MELLQCEECDRGKSRAQKKQLPPPRLTRDTLFFIGNSFCRSIFIPIVVLPFPSAKLQAQRGTCSTVALARGDDNLRLESLGIAKHCKVLSCDCGILCFAGRMMRSRGPGHGLNRRKFAVERQFLDLYIPALAALKVFFLKQLFLSQKTTHQKATHPGALPLLAARGIAWKLNAEELQRYRIGCRHDVVFF